MTKRLPFEVAPYGLGWRVQSIFVTNYGVSIGGAMFTSKAMSLPAAERLRDRMNFAYRCGEKHL